MTTKKGSENTDSGSPLRLRPVAIRNPYRPRIGPVLNHLKKGPYYPPTEARGPYKGPIGKLLDHIRSPETLPKELDISL